MFDWQAVISTLPIVAKGMAGVFGVIIVIWIAIAIMIRVFK
jgi:hypothetical protein